MYVCVFFSTTSLVNKDLYMAMALQHAPQTWYSPDALVQWFQVSFNDSSIADLHDDIRTLRNGDSLGIQTA